MITNIRYTTADNISVALIDNGSEWFTAYPIEGEFEEKANAWYADGNTITPYDEFYGWSDEHLLARAYEINLGLGQAQVEAAEATPSNGVSLSPNNTRKENTRRNNRAKRNAGMTDADDAMADYVDSVMDAIDLGDDAAEVADRATLETWDGSGMTFPIWSPPV